jgi:hypothetical protein
MTAAPAALASSPLKKPRPAKVRAAITNGTCLHLGKVGAVSVAGRRFADLVRILSDERGGAEALDTAKRAAIRAYAALLTEREAMETRLARGEPFDVKLYGETVDRCDRLYRRIGPVEKPKTPSLRDRYLAREAAQ